MTALRVPTVFIDAERTASPWLSEEFQEPAHDPPDRPRTAPADEEYVSIDPSTSGALFDIGMVAGALGDLTVDGVLVDDDEAERRGIGVGDTIDFQFLNGARRTLTVQGIYTEQDMAGALVVHHALHEQSGTDQFDVSVST